MATKPHRENYTLLLPAKGSKTAGKPERGWKVINIDAMRAAEKIFWAKRGYDSPPETTAAGVMQ